MLEFFNQPFIFAFMLTLFAGLSTGIGSLMAFLSKDFNHKFLAGALGFSAGVMIFVSFVEIYPKAIESLDIFYGDDRGFLFATIGFFIGSRDNCYNR
jgi:zinc transporter, ZIP family